MKILTEHLHVMKPKGREVHYFDQFKLPPENEASAEDLCSYRYKYVDKSFGVEYLMNLIAQRDSYGTKAMFSVDKTPSYRTKAMLSVDKTPSYLIFPGVASTVRRLYGPNIKIVAILRDPVQRLYSQYLMWLRDTAFKKKTSPSEPLPREERSFDEYVQTLLDELKADHLSLAPDLLVRREEVEQAQKQSHLLHSNNSTTRSSRRVADDASLFEPQGTFEERIRKVMLHRRRIAYRKNGLYVGMYAQQLSEWLGNFQLDSNIKIVRYEDLQGVNRTRAYQEIFDFMRVKGGGEEAAVDREVLEENYHARQKAVAHEGQKLSERTEEYLRQFYRPYNDELADLLGDKWRGIWD